MLFGVSIGFILLWKGTEERLALLVITSYAALKAADRAWADGHFDVSELAAYLNRLLVAQLADTGMPP